MTLQDIVDYCRALAIADSLSAGEVANWRYMCRQYSKAFHTPLHLVLEMEPEHVILAFFEDQMDRKDVDDEVENLLDSIYELEDPNYTAEKRSELDGFIKEAEREERERVKANKPIHPALRAENEVSLKNTPESPVEPTPDKPTGGHIDLSYLADNDNEG